MECFSSTVNVTAATALLMTFTLHC